MIQPRVRSWSRQHRRVRTRLWVGYGADSTDSAGCAECVSEGGLHISTNDVLGVGTHLALRIQFPDRAVSQQGEVRWTTRVPEHLRDEMIVCGMGIRFLDSDSCWPEFFRGWRSSLASSPAPALEPWDRIRPL